MNAAPIVLLHGFSGHATVWMDVVRALDGHRSEAITLFGHDPAVSPAEGGSWDAEVARVVASIRALDQPVRLCGYSMGGRVALGVIGSAPELVESAVLIGAHPGLLSDEERALRVAADELWARLLEDEGVEVFVDKWQAQPLFATQARLDPARLERQRQTRLRHDARSLARAMRSLGLGVMPSHWETLGRIAVPTELVVGGLDEKFGALALRMLAAMPPSLGRIVRPEGLGHNVAFERPELLADLLLRR